MVYSAVDSIVDGKQVVVTRELFIEAFSLPMEGINSFSGLPSEAAEDMKVVFFTFWVTLKPSSNRKEMKVECMSLNDIMAKYLTAKAGYFFDAITLERFDFTVAISTGIRVTGQAFYIALLLL
ncbi:transcription factor-like protein DPA [Dorcoceras hygrometricum]|uniref:Transcription factor-like protein DPA n=1 Tax=Dorcoceras hygrometricum TaxID=472368 RepID=A0A2Z7AUR0_9LAMI|nr:transcription factor-like protein DPA [Dorcoceras hygrometricum]